MRIANQTMIRNYTNTLNTNLSRLNAYSERIASNRRFMSFAENTALGVRAMQVRRNISDNKSYQETVKTINGNFKAAETQAMHIDDVVKDVLARYTVALNGTNGPEELETFATELEQLAKEILNSANGQFSDRYLFGGTNVTTQPFTIDDSVSPPTLFYNGFDVTTIDPSTHAYLFEDAAYVDIGLGLKYDNGTLDKNSAYKSTLNGLDFLGYGDDNIYNIIMTMADTIRNGYIDSNGDQKDFYDDDHCAGLLTQLQGARSNLLLGITDIGVQTKFLDYTQSRMKDDYINLAERQDNVEGIDPTEAIMEMTLQQYIYNAALAMGQKLMQPTLFNFIS